MVITVNDYNRLMGLMEEEPLKTKMPDPVSRLYDGLMNASRLSQENISSNVITMNSTVLLQDTVSKREASLTLTYPKDADNRQGKISVFSAIGAALLGKQVGDVVSWKTPVGYRQFEIVKIVYQPEAVGDFTL